MNLSAKQKQTHRHKRTDLLFCQGELGARGIVWEFGISMYTLSYLKQKHNKDLRYGTGNLAQYSVLTEIGKESEKEKKLVSV